MTLTQLLFLNFTLAAYLTGVIWVVQLVTYPALLLVGKSEFPRYHAALSPDYQIIFNPGYNTSRVSGPVHVVALRVHVEF